MDHDLKPCPFCGGSAELDSMRGYRKLGDAGIGNEAAIYCTSCGADMATCYADVPDLSHEEVVANLKDAWNRRVAT